MLCSLQNPYKSKEYVCVYVHSTEHVGVEILSEMYLEPYHDRHEDRTKAYESNISNSEHILSYVEILETLQCV